MSRIEQRVTAGRIDAILRVLDLAIRFTGSEADAIDEMLGVSGELGGCLPSEGVLRLTLFCGLVDTCETVVVATQTGQAIHGLAVRGKVVEARRAILARVIRHARTDLLALAFLAPAQVTTFADDDVLQCLRELELLSSPLSADAEQWWEALRSSAAVVDQDYLKSLGDAAEAATVAFERRRLRKLGRVDLCEDIIWVSRLDETAGFDVLSYVGDSSLADPPDTRLRIEVKACGAFERRYRFFLSRHEWKVSQSQLLPYVFHLWRAADLALPNPQPLAIVAATRVHSWVPGDNLPCGRWTDSRIEPPDDFWSASGV